MPWDETNAMEQRVQFIRDWLTRKHYVSALCERYGVSCERLSGSAVFWL